MSWVIVTKDSSSQKFYPIDVLAANLPNSIRLDYTMARSRPNSFWNEKKVIFHMTWAGKFRKVWQTYYRNIIPHTSQFWIEFDADRHMNRLQNIDRSMGQHLSMYNRIYKHSNKFLWELPIMFNPFVEKSIRIPMGIYEPNREINVIQKGRDIDFLGFIDQSGYNTANTLRLLSSLTRKYKVKCLVVGNREYSFYSRKPLGFEIIRASKTDPGQKKFYELLNRTKVYIDLSYRITLGRNLYEALFNGALCICPTTYGSSELLFPDLMVDPTLIDLINIHDKCIDTVKKWSPDTVKTYRRNAISKASIKKTIRRLQANSK